MKKALKIIGISLGALVVVAMIGIGVLFVDVLDAEDEVAEAHASIRWFLDENYSPALRWANDRKDIETPARLAAELDARRGELTKARKTVFKTRKFQLSDEDWEANKQIGVEIMLAAELAGTVKKRLEGEVKPGDPGAEGVQSFRIWASDVDAVFGSD